MHRLTVGTSSLDGADGDEEYDDEDAIDLAARGTGGGGAWVVRGGVELATRDLGIR